MAVSRRAKGFHQDGRDWTKEDLDAARWLPTRSTVLARNFAARRVRRGGRSVRQCQTEWIGS